MYVTDLDRSVLVAVGLGCLASLVACSGTMTDHTSASDGGQHTEDPEQASDAGTTDTRTRGDDDRFGNADAAVADEGPAKDAAAANPGTEPCAEGVANTSPVVPTVWLVVDGSSSMDTDYDGVTRWQALRASLMDPGGVVDRLQAAVRFGMVVYVGPRSSDTVLDECVTLTVVDPALDNYDTIDAAYPLTQPEGSTATHRALQYVVDQLPVRNEDVLDEDRDPVYVILATDGGPNDRCTNPEHPGGIDPAAAARVVEVVRAGTEQGMELFVISLAGDDTDLEQHLNEVVSVTASHTPPFVPASRDELIATFEQIVGSASCIVSLEGRVQQDLACTGEVTLNGEPLACGTDDGFRLLDESTLRLTGPACETFQATQSQVHATFPCGVFTPD